MGHLRRQLDRTRPSLASNGRMRARTAVAITPFLTIAANAAIALILWLGLRSDGPRVESAYVRPSAPLLTAGPSVTPPYEAGEARWSGASARALPDPDEVESPAEIWRQLTGHAPGERDDVPCATASQQNTL